MSNDNHNNLLDLFESLLRAQLNTIKQLKKGAGLTETETPPVKRMSHMEMVYDILYQANTSLHVNDIIIAAKSRFGVELDKESVVSALLKRVKRQDRFIKTGPNTFALIVLVQREMEKQARKIRW